MERNIEKYVEDYKNQPFRQDHELIRKEFLIEHLRKMDFRSILEVGCGFDSIANSLDSENGFEKKVMLAGNPSSLNPIGTAIAGWQA